MTSSPLRELTPRSRNSYATVTGFTTTVFAIYVGAVWAALLARLEALRFPPATLRFYIALGVKAEQVFVPLTGLILAGWLFLIVDTFVEIIGNPDVTPAGARDLALVRSLKSFGVLLFVFGFPCVFEPTLVPLFLHAAVLFFSWFFLGLYCANKFLLVSGGYAL